MSVHRRLFFVFALFFSLVTLGAISAPKIEAACTVNSCSAIFARDAQLTQRITTLQQESQSAFTPASVYFGYEMRCDSGDTVTLPYCFDTGSAAPVPDPSRTGDRCRWGQKIDAVNTSFITSNGRTYFVGRIPDGELAEFTNSYANDPGRLLKIQTVVWSGNFLCGADSELPASYLSESCGITGEPVRRQAGGYTWPVTVETSNLIPGKSYSIIFSPHNTLDILAQQSPFTVNSQHSPVQQGFDNLQVNAGTYRVCVVSQDSNDVLACSSQHCEISKNLDASLPLDDPEFSDPNPDSGNPQSVAFSLCRQVAEADRSKCLACYGSGAPEANEADGIANDTQAPTALWTAFGCVQTSPTGMIQSFLRIILGLAGGIVLLVILYGAFLLTTSSGDPKRVQEGQEMVTSAIMGILFIIFSVIILQFIGVKLLQIPGFGT